MHGQKNIKLSRKSKIKISRPNLVKKGEMKVSVRFLSLCPIIINLWAFSNYQLKAHFLYSITICMSIYNPQHVSSSTLLIFRTNCIITASGIVTFCTEPYSMPVESGLTVSPLSTGILYGRLQRETIPEAVLIQFVLLKMSKVLLETCWGL